MSEPSTPKLTIACIYAHPDDGEFWAGGSLAKWTAAGHRVHAICATDGSLGAKTRHADRAAVAAARERELAAALAVVGAEPPTMLGFPDGFLADHARALRERLVHELRTLRPDRIVTFDPWKRYEVHPDHVTAGRMACEAAVFSCFPLLHEHQLTEGCKAHQPREVWFMGPLDHKPNRVVDITKTLDKKVEATLQHGSQMEMLADWFVKGADPLQLTEADRAQLRAGATGFLDGMGRGIAMGLGGKVEIAEAFYALKTGPGHFDNQQTMIMEMLGMPAEDPTYE